MIALTALVFVTLPTLISALTYDCYSNGTIVVDNTEVNKYRASFANDTTSICTTTYSADYSELTITGCSMDDQILLVFTNRTIEDNQIIGGIYNEAYEIQCNDIPTLGISRSDIITFTPTLVTDAAVSSISPSITLEAAFRNGYTFGTSAEVSAVLTTSLYLTLDIPIEYYGYPTDCTVKSGTNFNAAGVLSKTLITDGCSDDDDLMGDYGSFEDGTSQGLRRLYATFYVFKFYDSDYIVLRCIVTYCKLQSDCATTCSKRRRREQPVLDTEQHIATAVLRVVDPATLSTATAPVPGTLLLLLGCLLTR